MQKKRNYPILFSLLTLFILVFSFIASFDRFTWVLEVFPILLGLPILFFTYRKFPLTNLVYILLIIHFVILSVGGIYTYAKVPLGFWVQDWFDLSRNNYDKLGHFVQGFIPAILIREVLIRTSPLRPGRWLGFIIVSICLAISAMYELIEWCAAVIQGASAEAFLGTQGDPWDAQSDMFIAFIGAIIALLVLSRYHNKLLLKNGYKIGIIDKYS